MKEDFISKWSSFWILLPEYTHMTQAFRDELEALIEHEIETRRKAQ